MIIGRGALQTLTPEKFELSSKPRVKIRHFGVNYGHHPVAGSQFHLPIKSCIPYLYTGKQFLGLDCAFIPRKLPALAAWSP